MSYLADTHVLLWFALDPERLGRRAHDVLTATDEPVFFSMASVWEIAIKLSLGKLRLDGTLPQFVAQQISNGFTLLPIQVSHAAQQAALPWHHRDPFDRLLIAQAIEEDLTIVTGDPAFRKYRVKRIW